jgi:hypothetical protein
MFKIIELSAVIFAHILLYYYRAQAIHTLKLDLAQIYIHLGIFTSI